MVGKLSVSAFRNFFWIENPLSIKEVMSQNVCVCSFPIFHIFDIHMSRFCLCWRCTRAGTSGDPDVVLSYQAFWVQVT